MAERKKLTLEQKMKLELPRGISLDKRTGLFVVSIELPKDPLTNKRRSKVVRREWLADAKVVRRDLTAELITKGNLISSSTPTAVYMRYWLKEVDKSRPRTRAGYRSKIEQYIVPAIGKIRIDQLTTDDVRHLEHYIVRAKGLSPTSALQTYQILAKALKDAEAEGRVNRNVARLVKPPRKAVPKLSVLTSLEAAHVIEFVSQDRLGSRWATALLTGMRQGEALGIELDRLDLKAKNATIDLSWQLQQVAWHHGCGDPVGTYENTGKPMYPCRRIRGTDCHSRLLDAPPDWEHRRLDGGLYLSRPKSRAGWREVPLVEPLRSIIERRVWVAGQEPNPHGLLWTAPPKGYKNTKTLLPLDGSPITPNMDNETWHTILGQAGVPDMRLHDARHTAVTVLYDLGIPEVVIQAIVGQSTISTTRGYRHNNPGPLIEALTQLGGAMSIQPAISSAVASTSEARSLTA